MLNPDWSMPEATQESLREHMQIVKNDEALIRQMLEALERCTKHEDADYAAIAAARARLGEGGA